jgi:hypothetical protein
MEIGNKLFIFNSHKFQTNGIFCLLLSYIAQF